ncbi:MAG: RdgB/HAM1 family non-canonical purine NTP pyrophosphatase [Trueperaceae bacterium]
MSKDRPTTVRLVLASGNPGKIEELRDTLAGRPIEVVGAADVGVTDFPPEDGASYEANALVKAAHVATHTGLPALADDSGLEVDALHGQPGLHSARFGGPGLTDRERVAHLLAKMRRVPAAERTARFVSVLALAVPSGEVRTFEGRCEGTIRTGPVGAGGFGYDPVFHSADLDRTFGEVGPEQKRRVSHRARAMAALLAWLDDPEAASVLQRAEPFRRTDR